ncbi:MAG: T9SS type A sorting domain-containing protein [bacterium]
MKRKLIFILLNLFAISLFAQDFLPGVPQNDLDIIHKLNGSARYKDSTTFYRPSNATLFNWNDPDINIYYTYDPQGVLQSEEVQYPYNAKQKITYSYKDNLLSYKTLDSLKNNQWQSIKQYFYTYNIDGNLSTILTQSWDDTCWINEKQDIYTYSDQNLLDKHITTKWANNDWVDIDCYTYIYDNNNLLVSLYFTMWENNNWTNKIRYRYQYNSHKLVAVYYIDYYSGSYWNETAKFVGSFDANWNVKSYVYIRYNMFLYIDEELERYTYTYDTYNNCTSVYHTHTMYGIMHFALTLPASGIVRVYFNNRNNFIEYDSPKVTIQYITFTDINDELTEPTDFNLSQNYPNPFNPATTIKFTIPSANVVTLKVYDILGSEVTTIVNEFKNAGTYEVNFNASNLASGVYFYSLQTGNFAQTKKLLLLK